MTVNPRRSLATLLSSKCGYEAGGERKRKNEGKMVGMEKLGKRS